MCLYSSFLLSSHAPLPLSKDLRITHWVGYVLKPTKLIFPVWMKMWLITKRKHRNSWVKPKSKSVSEGTLVYVWLPELMYLGHRVGRRQIIPPWVELNQLLKHGNSPREGERWKLSQGWLVITVNFVPPLEDLVMLLDLLLERRNQMYLENSRVKSTQALSGDMLLAPSHFVYFSLIISLLLSVSRILFTTNNPLHPMWIKHFYPVRLAEFFSRG